MSPKIRGIHHVTAIAGDPQQNVDFYTGLLGLRLVKLTVNFDDPGAYHLYYGDEVGHPGTILTFFSWPGAPQGRRGTGQVVTTSFSVPERALGFWMERFEGRGVPFEGPAERFDEQVVTFFDPDGLQLELVASPDVDERSPWQEGPVPPDDAIRGFYGVTLSEEGFESTDAVLTGTLGFRLVKEADNWFRYQVGDGGPAAHADVRVLPNAPSGRLALGTVHHVAWRTPNKAEQGAWRTRLAAQGVNVTPVIDRLYFHSIYFREPGGVLFEIATDPPGFTVDEPQEQLGTHLKLPPWLEPKRTRVSRLLPSLRLPQMEREQ
ncbi:MAG: ring-cleaving dioxygenase [Ardenticatenaceae bacterium]|nr:ring-cleaving dioxygenase [Ardenticatenaceae bacterium]HBY96798.1 ring-cleaving dioxygenase [Chloroflexota bacterium]